MPLDVVQDRGCDAVRVGTYAAGHISALVQARRFLEPEFPQDGTFKLSAERRRQRQPETRAHGHAQIVGAEIAGQRQYPIGSLVSAAAMSKQYERIARRAIPLAKPSGVP